MMKVKCPKCNQSYDIEKGLLNKKVECENCLNVFFITERCLVSNNGSPGSDTETVVRKKQQEILIEKKSLSALENATKYKGIAGWLIIVCIGLIFSFFSYIGSWATLNRLDIVQISKLNQGFANVLTFEKSYSLLLALLIFIALVLMFRKSKKFPKFMIAIISFSLITTIIDLSWAHSCFKEVPRVIKEKMLIKLISSIITALIWIPYFLVSKRVKQTFVAPDM